MFLLKYVTEPPSVSLYSFSTVYAASDRKAGAKCPLGVPQSVQKSFYLSVGGGDAAFRAHSYIHTDTT